jgi:hypothetical protein
MNKAVVSHIRCKLIAYSVHTRSTQTTAYPIHISHIRCKLIAYSVHTRSTQTTAYPIHIKWRKHVDTNDVWTRNITVNTFNTYNFLKSIKNNFNIATTYLYTDDLFGESPMYSYYNVFYMSRCANYLWQDNIYVARVQQTCNTLKVVITYGRNM